MIFFPIPPRFLRVSSHPFSSSTCFAQAVKMGSQLNPTPSFVAMKRARSSDQSAVASPSANSGDNNLGMRLPPFLAQSRTGMELLARMMTSTYP